MKKDEYKIRIKHISTFLSGNFKGLKRTLAREMKIAAAAEKFEEAAQDQLDLSKIIDKKLAADIIAAIKQRIKPKEIIVDGDITLLSYAPNGIELVKEALHKAADTKGKPVIRYKGAGTYHISITGDDYKNAEKLLKTAVDAVLESAKAHKMDAEFVRAEHD